MRLEKKAQSSPMLSKFKSQMYKGSTYIYSIRVLKNKAKRIQNSLLKLLEPAPEPSMRKV